MKLSVMSGAGKNRIRVGQVEAVEGLLTSAGRIEKVCSKSLVINGSRITRTDDLTVRRSEAARVDAQYRAPSQN